MYITEAYSSNQATTPTYHSCPLMKLPKCGYATPK